MIEALKNLFKPTEEPSDGLNQKQREAIIDLLLLCTYADNHLALSEDSILKAESDTFDWKSNQSIESYVDSVTPKIRQIRNEGDSRRAFIREAGERLDTVQAKSRALELTRKLFRSDGDLAEGEMKFEAELQKELGI